MEKIKKVDDEDFDYEAYYSLCLADELIDKGYSGIKKEYLNNGVCNSCGRKIRKNDAFCIGTKCEELEEGNSHWVYPKFQIYCSKCSWGE